MDDENVLRFTFYFKLKGFATGVGNVACLTDQRFSFMCGHNVW